MAKNNYLITYFLGTGLNPTEACLLSKIQEIEKNIGKCTYSNVFFADYLGISESTVRRSIARLKGLGLIEVATIQGSNRKKRKIRTDQPRIKRILLESGGQNDPQNNKSDSQNEHHFMKSDSQNDDYLKSDSQNDPQVIVKMTKSGGQNDPIKLKEKIKEKIKEEKPPTEEQALYSDMHNDSYDSLNDFDNEEILDLESYKDIEPVEEPTEIEVDKLTDYERLKEAIERNKDRFQQEDY